MVEAANLEISLFGEFRVWRGGNMIQNEEWNRQKTRSLLKLLLVRPGRAFPRAEILEALWPGAPTEAAERSLRVRETGQHDDAVSPQYSLGNLIEHILGIAPSVTESLCGILGVHTNAKSEALLTPTRRRV